MNKPVGLLTLQGDYDKHMRALHCLGVETFGVRRASELQEVSSLIIPGGESTTLTRLVDRMGLRQPLLDFAANNPVMGTCAGLIMMSTELVDEKMTDYGVQPLGLLDCKVVRNGFGRQVDSFTAPVGLDVLDGSQDPFPAVFIRAPRITGVGQDVDVLATWENEPVLVRQGNLLGMTFHPELTEDLRIHQAFLDFI
jgi:pyridoxal 5'-phosphate synthase pdxT subunit